MNPVGRLLVDTNVFLLLATDPKRVPRSYREAMDTADRRYLSTASAWEIAIKASIGKISLPESSSDYVRTRMERFQMVSLPVTLEHATRVQSLEFFHRDPFDRLLIAQALLEGLTILTTDRAFDAYKARVLPA